MKRPFSTITFIAVIGAGVLLRLICVSDMEYKADEWRMFQATQQVRQISDWPLVGMKSGVALRNPPMSAWVFIAPAKVLRLREPTDLARLVQIMSAAALILFAALVAFLARKELQTETSAWYWAVVLAAVNPFSIVMQRKIWSQSLLPFFSLILLGFWWKREKRWATFGLGFLGMMMGQVHMSGFFYLAALVGGLFFFARNETRWKALVAGIFVGSLSLFPWFYFLVVGSGASSSSKGLNPMTLKNLFQFRFWNLWVCDAAGLDLRASLGSNLEDYFRYPIINGVPTYLCGALYLALAITWGVILIGALRKLLPAIRRSDFLKKTFWKKLQGESSKSNQLLLTGFFAYGLLMTFLPFPFLRHYLLVAFPLTSYWLARLALRYAPRHSNMVLAGTVAAHLILSATFLYYIHENSGAPRGDYGTAYRAQAVPPSGNLQW